ncbi:hypothetical protein Tco_0764682 [Tanacetum coccineum]
MGEGSAIPTDPHHTPTFIQPYPQPQKTQKPRRPKKKDTQVPHSSVPSDNVTDKAVYKELDDSLVRAATTASRSRVGQWGGGFMILMLMKTLPWLMIKMNIDMFDVNTLTGDEVLAVQEVAAKDVNLTIDEVSLAQAFAALKSVKPKVKSNVIEEPSVPVSAASTKFSATTTTTTATIPTPRKGIIITELEEPVKMKKKDQISFDKQEAKDYKLSLAKVDDDYQLAHRLQAEEQEQFTTEQKATLFKELLEQRRKHFAAKRAEEKRNKPPTQSNKQKSCKMFDRAFKRVNTFVNYRTDLVEGSSKRAGDELEQEVTKKKKEEVAIDAIPLAIKPLNIID